jgi:hypothetical protein
VTVQITKTQQGYRIPKPKVIIIMTTFHGFLQQASSMLLPRHGLFCEGEGFYRGDLAEITTVYPILPKRRHFMVFFNMILPCLSHAMVYSVRGRVFYRGDLAVITTVYLIQLKRQHFMVFFNMILPCSTHTRSVS